MAAALNRARETGPLPRRLTPPPTPLSLRPAPPPPPPLRDTPRRGAHLARPVRSTGDRGDTAAAAAPRAAAALSFCHAAPDCARARLPRSTAPTSTSTPVSRTCGSARPPPPRAVRRTCARRPRRVDRRGAPGVRARGGADAVPQPLGWASVGAVDAGNRAECGRDGGDRPIGNHRTATPRRCDGTGGRSCEHCARASARTRARPPRLIPLRPTSPLLRRRCTPRRPAPRTPIRPAGDRRDAAAP